METAASMRQEFCLMVVLWRFFGKVSITVFYVFFNEPHNAGAAPFAGFISKFAITFEIMRLPCCPGIFPLTGIINEDIMEFRTMFLKILERSIYEIERPNSSHYWGGGTGNFR